jgi:hypothetical protein
MARRTARQIRIDAMEEERIKSSSTIREINRRTYERNQRTRGPKLAKVDLKRQTTCCLDKERELPKAFRQCVDCPKLTEVGSETNGGGV